MAEIHVLPGIERRDLAGAPVPSAEVLQSAIDKGVMDVIIVGRSRDGSLFIAGAPPDVDKAVGMLMRAVSVLAASDIVNDVVLETSPK